MSLAKKIPVPSTAGFIQFDVKLGDFQANLTKVQKFLTHLDPQPGTLIVLPELWASGFAYEDIATVAGKSQELLGALRELAARYRIVIAGSLLEEEAEKYYNTLFISGANGVIGQYRKQQLFGPMSEDVYLKPGLNPYPISTPYGTFAALICYDLRFPELAAFQVSRGAGVIIITAQWPEIRLDHWQTLLRARAIENQAFVVACNRCGTTNATKFAGHSMIIAPNGTVIRETNNEETAAVVNLDAHILQETRDKFNTAAPRPYYFADQDKICRSHSDLQNYIKTARAVGKKIVFTNGCFDIIHQGHTAYLEKARQLGDCLVIGLNSDCSIRAIKGPQRPINSERSRARVLAALGCVDYIAIFDEETPLNLIKAIIPDTLVKGADWPIDKIVGAKEVMSQGGQVINISMVEGFSTTNIIGTIRERGTK